jgi:hypothetical protein
MSDMQDLIHTNAHNAFGIGVRTERERIIKLLRDKKITSVLSLLAVSTIEDNPQIIRDQAWRRIDSIIEGEDK